MNKISFCRLVFITIPLLFNSAQSQPDHFAYAMTAVNKGGSEWIALRKLDTRTGEFSNILLNMQEKDQNLFGLAAYKINAMNEVSNPATNPAGGLSSQTALGSSVAAIAYDKKANRLYFTPMNVDQLRYIDLSTMEVFSVPDQFFSRAGNYNMKNAGPINRMVIAPDDYGYTITNDGNHLIRFTTNGAPVLTDLGELLDNPLNLEMTIHSPCTNSGGDMIADNAGNLYLISGSNRVFKVDITTRETSYLATVSGLPQKFTTSGAAVTEDGRKIVVSSAVYPDGYFLIDPETWTASPAQTTHETYGSADLANSNVLFTKAAAGSNLFITRAPENPSRVRVFPNPVMDDEVSIQFNGLPPGNYTIQLANVLGRRVLQQKATIAGQTQTETMHIPGFTAQGFYYIHILDENNHVVSTEKLVVERW